MIFIIGSAKSGTTWLKNCFSHVTPVSYSNEWYFAEFADAIKCHVATYGANLSADTQDLIAIHAIKEGWKGLVDAATPGAVMDKSAYPTGLRRISAEQRQIHSYAVRLARQTFSEAKIILMVRDPRAVYNSLQHFRNHRKSGQHSALSNVVYEIRTKLKSVSPRGFAQSWNMQNSSWLADGPTVICKYEELKANFPGTLQNIFEACDLDVSNQKLLEIQDAEYDIRKAERRQEELFISDPTTIGSSKSSKLYRKGEIDDWKKHVSPRALRAISTDAKVLMTEFGYL